MSTAVKVHEQGVRAPLQEYTQQPICGAETPLGASLESGAKSADIELVRSVCRSEAAPGSHDYCSIKLNTGFMTRPALMSRNALFASS